MIPPVVLPAQMFVDKYPDGGPVEEPILTQFAFVECILEQRFKNTAKPRMNRNIETDFGPCNHLWRQRSRHQVAEHDLGLEAVDLEPLRQARGEVHDAVIQKR